MYIHTHTYIYIYIYTHTHIYIYTYIFPFLSFVVRPYPLSFSQVFTFIYFLFYKTLVKSIVSVEKVLSIKKRTKYSELNSLSVF